MGLFPGGAAGSISSDNVRAVTVGDGAGVVGVVGAAADDVVGAAVGDVEESALPSSALSAWPAVQDDRTRAAEQANTAHPARKPELLRLRDCELEVPVMFAALSLQVVSITDPKHIWHRQFKE